MTSYEAALAAAVQLSSEDRLRLIDALVMDVPTAPPPPLNSNWLAELEHRVQDIDNAP